MALSTMLRDEGDSSEEDYRRKRDKNNQAVKRSRVKSRMRTQQTLQRVNQLKTENDILEEKIKLLSKELGFLKELFMAQAGKYDGIHRISFLIDPTGKIEKVFDDFKTSDHHTVVIDYLEESDRSIAK